MTLVKNKELRRTIIAWIVLLFWVGFILSTLTLVPQWRDVLQKKYGEGVFATITYIGAGILIAIILSVMIFKNREKKPFPYLVLIGIFLLLSYIMRQWITIPVEQIHFVEYGLVGYFSFNALRHHLRGWALITAALLLTYLFGMIDESVQGLTAVRVGEQRDMYWNGLAGVMASILIAFSLKPAIVYLNSGRREVRAHLMILLLCPPLQGFFNTVIAQFGVLIEDNKIGCTFRSRLHPDELRGYEDHLDQFKSEIAPKVGKVRTVSLLGQVYNKIHEEALVHSFRRAHYLKSENYYVTSKENSIVREYFQNFVAGTELDWSPERSAEIAALAGDSLRVNYESPVAAHLITKFTQTRMWVLIIFLEIGIALWLYLLIPPHRKT
ncbi:MAG: VanZ family protein [bacterium]|nr:VanZ family protein [bacterium]